MRMTKEEYEKLQEYDMSLIEFAYSGELFKFTRKDSENKIVVIAKPDYMLDDIDFKFVEFIED